MEVDVFGASGSSTMSSNNLLKRGGDIMHTLGNHNNETFQTSIVSIRNNFQFQTHSNKHSNLLSKLHFRFSIQITNLCHIDQVWEIFDMKSDFCGTMTADKNDNIHI